MILSGVASGQPEPLELQLLASSGSLYVQRPTLQTYARTPQLLATRAEQLFALIAAGKLEVRIGARHPLEHARQAHEDLEARRTSGRLLLIP
jgi:NADPH:quinone reductase